MSEMPVLALPSKPSFMVVDGKTYLVEQVTESPQDLLKDIETFYKENLENLRAQVANHFSTESQDDLHKQVQRIERHLAAGIVALPENARSNGEVLYLQNNKVYKSRIVLFKPSRISCTMQRVTDFVFWIEQRLSKREAERYSAFLNWAKPLLSQYHLEGADTSNIKVDIMVNQDIILSPMVVTLVTDENLIYVSPRGVHPHVHTTGNLCTGTTDARIFWEDVRFIENFNSLNPHSWANSANVCADNFRQFLRNSFLVEAKIRSEEVSAWRV